MQYRKLFPFIIWLFLISIVPAQDARESLGPKDKTTKNVNPHPLTTLMKDLNSSLKPELRGKHPRVYMTEGGLEQLRTRANTTHRELWLHALAQVRALKKSPPPPPAQERRAQNEIGIGIAEAALAYKIEGDKKYLEAAKAYIEAAVSYDIWGYAYNKPNVDLAAGHLLYGMGWGYDLLYHDLSDAERERYRNKISKHARLLFEYYKPKPGRSYSYSQNHVFIPMAGLGVAAYALYDEVEDASQWAALARAIFDRTLATYSTDGYYYEGFEYWIFSTPWLVHYMDAHAHATGEDLYNHPGFKNMHLYVAHSMLPDGQYVFDFGDIFEGPLTRRKEGKEYKRSHPDGRFHTNYNILYRMASRFRSEEAQGIAAWMKGLNHYNAEDYWSLLWYDSSISPLAINKLKTSHYFRNHEVVFWRSDWTPQAIALAVKCGPPEGHHANTILKSFSDWHLSSGHAHPDAAGFMIFGGGRFLTGDSGYAGLPMTNQHNTVLIDGIGQAREGKGHNVFEDIPYDRLDKIRISEVRITKRGKNRVAIVCDASSAYEPELGVKSFIRKITLNNKSEFLIKDEIQTDKPRIISSFLHSDEKIDQLDKHRFVIINGMSGLNVSVPHPDNNLDIKIEPNSVTGAGRPGAVDKGDAQLRGVRLNVSTRKRSTVTRITMKLSLNK